MSINLKFKVCESTNSASICFTEETGIYDAVDNTAGWGVPNEIIGDVVTSSLVLKSPSGVLYPSIDMVALGFPKINATSKEIKASAVDAGLTVFEDGFWEITYTATTSTKTYVASQCLFFYSQSKKVVCNLVANMHIDDCSCDSEGVKQALQMHAYLLSLGYAVGLEDTSSTLKIFAALQNLIKCSICK